MAKRAERTRWVSYALHLIDRVDVHVERVVIVPKVAGGRKEPAMLAAAE